MFGDREGWIQRRASTAALDVRVTPALTLSLAGGAVLGGRLTVGAEGFSVGPGWLASATVSGRVLDGLGSKPFMLLSATLAASHADAWAERGGAWGRLEAYDLRGALVVGKTFFEVLSPYAAVRAFGGPVVLGERLGGDRYHLQLAAGLVASLPGGFDLFAEIAPGPERAVSAGAGRAF